MLTVEQYISQMKKKDKLDEFNFKNHAENMTTVIRYVMEYFNNYLNPEAYDYENIKIEQTALKIEQDIETTFPKSKDFIIDYYKKYKTRIDKTFTSWLKDLKYFHLFYCTEDYKDAVDLFCDSAKMRGTGIEEYKDRLITLAQEIKENETEKPSISGFKHLDNSLVSWVKEVYREYGVNLFQFAQGHTMSYYDEYIEHIYCRETEEHYRINRYNHRYNDNPFGMDELYKENGEKPFINGKKGEVEMLIMYVWVFDDVMDTDYWSEYVNLCISTGRVSIVKNINVLIPVKSKCINYPEEIKSNLVYVETTTGTIGINPDGPYILKLHYEKDNDLIWRDDSELNKVIKNLNDSFVRYGVPYAIELLSPLRSQTYNEEEFFKQYRLFEKGMRKYPDIKIALVNGPHRHSAKPKYLIQFTEDIVRARAIVKEMKFKLKFAIDISKLMVKKSYRSQFENDFNKLSEIRNSIIGIHLSSIPNSTSIRSRGYSDDNRVYLNKHDYHENSDFLGGISALFNDNLSRYFVAEEVGSAYALEEVVDDLLRGGFSFCSWEGDQ